MIRNQYRMKDTFTKTSQYSVTIHNLFLPHDNSHNESIADTHYTITLDDWLIRFIINSARIPYRYSYSIITINKLGNLQ